MACINTNHPDYLKLIEDLALRNITNPVSIQAKILQYQELNGTTEFPDLDFFITDKSVIQFNKINNQEELNKVDGSTNIANKDSIKQGVDFVFEQNPELANAVYEALGFKSKPDVILPIGTSGSGKSTFIKSLPQENLVVIEPDAMRVEFTGNMNDKSKDIEIYIEAANRAIQAIKQDKQVVFDTTNLTKDKRLPFIKAIKKAIPNANIQYKLMELNPELAKQRIKAQLARGENRAAVSDETIDRHAASYKQMLEDIKNEPISNFELTLQQKQQAQQLYSQYLDTIFPDSKVKDIVFHGTDVKFDTFRDEFLGKKDPGYKGKGFYFWHGKKALEGAKHVAFAYLNRSITSEDVIAALINLKNPKEIISGDYSYTGKILEGFDGAIEVPYSSKKIKPYKTGTSEVMVRSASQIYILGSEEDIAGFKQFVESNNTNASNKFTSNNEFDTLFPEYSHLSPEEKAIVMKGVENGDLSISCTGGFKAAHGVVTSNKLGSKWSLVKDLKGYNSHEYGGVDININNGSVTIGKGDGNVEAANGLIIFKV